MLQVMRLACGMSEYDLTEMPGKLIDMRVPAGAQALSFKWDSDHDDYFIYVLCDAIRTSVSRTFLIMLSEEPMEGFIREGQSVRFIGSCVDVTHENMWHCFEVLG